MRFLLSIFDPPKYAQAYMNDTSLHIRRCFCPGYRKAVAPTTTAHETNQQEEGMASLLKEMMEEQASTGLTPPYLPTKKDRGEDDE